MVSMRFKNKHVAITGGTGEIGLHIAREFTREGASVTLLDLTLPDALESQVHTMGARFQRMDVTDPQSVTGALSELPDIDIAIANAGIHRGARALDLSFENWKLMLDVNVTGVFLFSQAVARQMVKRGQGGVILVTGSWVQDIPHVDNTGYCSSKAAAAMVAQCMALELGEHGIVAPGIVNAGMARRQLLIDPVFAKTATKGIPLGRLQSAQNVADAALFLCSSEADSITGHTLAVDGGLHLFQR
jgi:NAD(P)-dependent dehydrogenase (short-subunit alcohol dehydrogenase family)